MFLRIAPRFPIGIERRRQNDIFPIGNKSVTKLKVGPQRVRSSNDLGSVVRDVRKQTALDQQTTADLVGVGPRFLSELERGKPSVRLALVLKVLERLGLELWIAPRGWKP